MDIHERAVDLGAMYRQDCADEIADKFESLAKAIEKSQPFDIASELAKYPELPTHAAIVAVFCVNNKKELEP